MLPGMVFLVALALDAAPPKAPPYQPSDCLALLSEKASVASVTPAESGVVGNWHKGSFLSGSDLYLFPDHSYIYTEWADIMPETIYDKGSWTLEANFLNLSPDSDIVWDPGADRRYLTLRERSETQTLLFGLDRTLPIFLELVEEYPGDPQGYFRVSVLRKLRAWSQARASRVKAALLKNSWRPCFFTKVGCLEPTANCDQK